MYKSVIEDLSLFEHQGEATAERNNAVNQDIARLIESYFLFHKGGVNGTLEALPARSVFQFLPQNNHFKNGSSAKEVLHSLKLYYDVMFLCYHLSKSGYYPVDHPLDLDSVLAGLRQSENMDTLDQFRSEFGAVIDTVTSEFYAIFSKENEFVVNTFPDKESFRIYVLSLYVNDCFNGSLDDEEIMSFQQRWELHRVLLGSTGVQEREQWWNLAGSFFGLNREIGDSYLHLDSIRIRNSLIESKWLKVFSIYELKLQDIIYQKKLLEVQITLKNQNSSLSLEECYRNAKVELIKEENKIQALRSNSLWAKILDPGLYERMPHNYDQLIREYRQKADYLFRRAAKLLHPDRRPHILEGRELSPGQEAELNELYHELMSTHEGASLSAVDLMVGDVASPHKIINIIAKAELIFLTIGVKISKMQFVILGDTLAAQLEFLVNEYKLLQVELAHLQASIQVLYSDKEIYQKESVLKNPEAIQAVRERYESMLEMYQKDTEVFQKELNNLFGDTQNAHTP
jgi:hypothetical protein